MFRMKNWFAALSFDFLGLHLTLICPWFGFEVMYLAFDASSFGYKSGYRIYREGMKHKVPGQCLAVFEEVIFKYRVEEVLPLRRRTRWSL